MVSVNDAMEHSNVSWFAKFLSIFLISILGKYFFDRNIEHSINIFISRLVVPVRSMNGKKETILPFDDENQNYSILSNLRSNHRFDIDHPPKLLICKKTLTQDFCHDNLTIQWLIIYSWWFTCAHFLHYFFCAMWIICCHERSRLCSYINLYLQSRKWPIDKFYKSPKKI